MQNALAHATSPSMMASSSSKPATRSRATASSKPTIAKPAATSVVDDKRDNALLDALRGLFSCCGSPSQRHSSVASGGPSQRRRPTSKKVSFKQILHLVRRLLVVLAAVRYLWVSVDASVASLRVLRGARIAPMTFEAYDTSHILSHVGSREIATSPLVLQTMQNDTSRRPFTYFLEANGVVSTTNCSTPNFRGLIYSTYYLRLAMGALMRDISFHVREFASHEVVVPVVDCSFTPLVQGDDTAVRVFYVMRDKATRGDLLLASVRFSMQDYKILEQNEHGPIGMGSVDIIRDMRTPQLTSQVGGTLGRSGQARVVGYAHNPLNASIDPPKRVFTARRTGFFLSSDSEQSNIKNLYWTIHEPPALALSKWNWKGEPVLKDSWAWVHLFHVGFALDVLFNLSVLLLVIYRNLQDGKIWVGDAFVSISSTLITRGVVIVASWGVNGFWALMEFCLHDAHTLAGTQDVFVYPQIMRADLLTVYLACASVCGYACRERIDPAFAIVVFEILFAQRREILQWFPSALATITAFAHNDHWSAVLSVSETVAAYSPMRQWTTHTLPAVDVAFILSCLVPIASSGVILLAYIALRKIYARVYHEKITKLNSKNTAAVSEDEASLLVHKRSLTLFEIATGAELQSRFGIVCDYENCLFIKGMKYASADGIFSNGFVIVSGRFVVSTADLMAIVVLKLIKLPLRVYAYELKGNTVQQTAHLVNSDTFTWRELSHLNVMVLS